MTPLSTGDAVYRPPTTEAANDFRTYVSQDEALAAAYEGCPDGEPTVVKDPAGVPAGYYPACAATGVFYSSVRGALEELAQQILETWTETDWL